MDNTITWPDHMLTTRAMARVIVKEGALKDYADKETMISKFMEYTDRAKNTVPADQLLIFQLSQGWGLLCKFLDIPTPDLEFPKSNCREDFLNKLRWVRQSIETGKYLSAM